MTRSWSQILAEYLPDLSFHHEDLGSRASTRGRDRVIPPGSCRLSPSTPAQGGGRGARAQGRRRGHRDLEHARSIFLLSSVRFHRLAASEREVRASQVGAGLCRAPRPRRTGCTTCMKGVLSQDPLLHQLGQGRPCSAAGFHAFVSCIAGWMSKSTPKRSATQPSPSCRTERWKPSHAAHNSKRRTRPRC